MGEIPLTDIPIPLFEPYLIPSSIRFIGAGRTGDYLFQEFPFAGGFIRLTHLMEREENKIMIIDDNNHPGIVFHLELQNTLNYRLDDIGEMVFHEWGYNFYHTGSLLKELHFSDRKDYVILGIHLSMDYLRDIGRGYEFVEDFLLRIQAGRPAKLACVNQVAGYRMMDKVQTLVGGDLISPDEWVKELLVLAIDQQAQKPTVRPCRLSAAEVEKIYEVRRFLFANLHTLYTQEELACRMKMSEYQLRTGFQEIYGMTSMELCLIERMHRACALIKKGDKKMWEVALLLGYSSKNSFLKAYKKYYGETPSAMLAKS